MNNRVRQTCRAFALATRRMRVHMETDIPIEIEYVVPGTVVNISCFFLAREVPKHYRNGFRFSPRGKREYIQMERGCYVK